MRKILSVDQMRELDQFTIREEGITSSELMERAGKACFQWLKNHYGNGIRYLIYCGPGNNGGDGLVIARLLAQLGSSVYITRLGSEESTLSPDHLLNYSKLSNTSVREINTEHAYDEIFTATEKIVILDCLFGSGLNRPLAGAFAEAITNINRSGVEVISIDIPSGMFSDKISNKHEAIIKARFTLCFQLPRLAFFMSESEKYIGEFHLIDIGLSADKIQTLNTNSYQVTKEYLCRIEKSRSKHAHKGSFGHALIAAGSQGKAGAAILAVSSCLRSGSGLVTACIPDNIVQSVNISAPEAMTLTGGGLDHLVSIPTIGKFNALGIGPGIGLNPETAFLVKQIIHDYKIPVIFDADALNILAENPTWLGFLNRGAILTPHPGEFKRLVGNYDSDFEGIEKARAFAIKFGVILVLKGAYTAVVSTKGDVYFNSTGNPGMATGGSGDLLTGLITGMVARGYEPLDAAIRSVYLHGLAGDLAAKEFGEETMKAGDILACLPMAFRHLINNS